MTGWEKISFQQRGDYRMWDVFWSSRRIILQERYWNVRKTLDWLYHSWRKLCWWIKTIFGKNVFFSFCLGTYWPMCYNSFVRFGEYVRGFVTYLHYYFTKPNRHRHSRHERHEFFIRDPVSILGSRWLFWLRSYYINYWRRPFVRVRSTKNRRLGEA